MRIRGLIWLRDVIEKLERKHGVVPEEVEELFRNRPRFRYIAKGKIAGENLYAASGQSDSGRYLVVFFIYKEAREALVVTARDMTASERRQYGKA